MLCAKSNSCRPPGAEAAPCESRCVYGSTWSVGLAPSPYCPNLAAQTRCVAVSVEMGCDTYQDALAACPACPPVDGAPCMTDRDCGSYDPRYRCDLSKPGGYCTAPCNSAADCNSIGGPETCVAASPPSFDAAGFLGPKWCQLGCTSDAFCRTGEGYACTGGLCAQPQ